MAWLARVHAEQARWADAAALAAEVVAQRASPRPRMVALAVLGRVRARCGEPGVDGPLAEARELAVGMGHLQRLWPVAAARAEAAWLAGRPDEVAGLVGDTYALAVRLGHAWAIGELAYWLWRAGVPVDAAGAAAPYARTIAGDWRAARGLWTGLGCRYEAAEALATSPRPADRVAAMRELADLGAWPAAEMLARELRAEGIRGLPRRPRPATRANPGGLTSRELDVLALLDLRNAEIAATLHISEKTVGHHVSAILAKLGVSSRREAARWAAADGDPPVRK